MSVQDVLRLAQQNVGYHEGADNTNKFSAYLGHPPESWCGDFVSAIYAMSGHPLPSMQPGIKTGYASVGFGILWAKKNGRWIQSKDAQPGDAICYGWNGPGSSWDNMHTGLIVSSGPVGSTGHTIEGNRGDQVGDFTFTVGESVVLGCIRLHDLAGGEPQPKPVPRPAPHEHPHSHPAPAASHVDASMPPWHHGWPVFMVKTPFMRGAAVVAEQRRLNKRGWPHIAEDGVYGPSTGAATHNYQQDKHHSEGLAVDGRLGPATYASMRRTDNIT